MISSFQSLPFARGFVRIILHYTHHPASTRAIRILPFIIAFRQPLFTVLPAPLGFDSVKSSHSRAFIVSASAFS